MISPGSVVPEGNDPVAPVPPLAEGRLDGFGVAPSALGRSVLRGVGSGSGVGFGAGVTFGVGFGVGLGVGAGVGVARGWDGFGRSDGFANAITPLPSSLGCSIANAGTPMIAVTRMATATEADLARTPIGMVRIHATLMPGRTAVGHP